MSQLPWLIRRLLTRVGLARVLRPVLAPFGPVMRRDRHENSTLRQLLALWLPVNARCVDVGCDQGMVLDWCVQLAPKGRHIAYEPNPVAHSNLVRRFPSVDVRWAAVADRHGDAMFFHVTNMPALSGFYRQEYSKRARIEEITVSVESLDGCLPADFAPDFIKIDVEGAEQLVLEGAKQTLAKYQPLVAFEHMGKPGMSDSREVHRLLTGAGLRIFDMDGNGPYDVNALVAAAKSGERWNYVAHR